MTKKKPKKVAILGTTPTRMMAPIGDPEWDIWTIGPGGMNNHKWDRLYEVHNVWPEDFGEYLNELSEIKNPQKVYTLKPMKRAMEVWAQSYNKDEKWLAETIKGNWESNVVIDQEAVFTRFHRRMWFSSSISYALVLAIDEGYTDIGLFGIDLESGEEYISQFAGCAHFMDLARDRGINIHTPKGCGLLRDLSAYPDRYETDLALTFEKKVAWLNHILAQNEPEHRNLAAEASRTEGAILMLKKIAAGEELDPEALIKQGEQDLMALRGRVGALWDSINQLKGERAATEYYQRMYVWGTKDP
jgi:hypothetical protein